MHIFNNLKYINNSSLALGFFDGIHLGHKVVLKNAINFAKANFSKSCVVTFREHPSRLLDDNYKKMILSTDEKLSIFENLGIDNVFLLDFSDFMTIKAENYIKDILVKYFSPIAITTGFNHTFGYKKLGDSSLLKSYQNLFGYKYFEVPPFVVENQIVSSSFIRNKISISDFYMANKMLGYNFFINGIVIKGDQIASKLGFPSANIIYPPDKVNIQHGVYYVIVEIDGIEYNAILNHGYAPTFDDFYKLKTEVHIIDFNRDIYGSKIKVSFITKIRNQMKFDSIENLKLQLNRDIAFVDIYKNFVNSSIFIKCKKLFL